MGNPDSYLYNRRIHNTKIGEEEHEKAMDNGRFDEGRLGERTIQLF